MRRELGQGNLKGLPEMHRVGLQERPCANAVVTRLDRGNAGRSQGWRRQNLTGCQVNEGVRVKKRTEAKRFPERQNSQGEIRVGKTMNSG